MNTENSYKENEAKALSQDAVSGWSCYNCGCTEKDFYLLVNHLDGNQHLYDDIAFDLAPTDELVEFDICAECLASV